MSKTCTKCKLTKPLSEFWTAWDKRYSKRRHRPYCKECGRSYNTNKHGLTAQERDLLAERQEQKCAICGEEKQLVVDHDHETGRIRGMLCFKCNSAIGFLRDDPVLVKAALVYLGGDGLEC